MANGAMTTNEAMHVSRRVELIEVVSRSRASSDRNRSATESRCCVTATVCRVRETCGYCPRQIKICIRQMNTRRLRQFTLRSMLLLVAACACCLVLLRPYFERQNLRSRVSALGGITYFDCSDLPDWIRKRTSDETLESWGVAEVFTVNLQKTDADDADLEVILGRAGYGRIFLSYTDITDDGLRHLTKQPQLETVVLDHTEVGDEGLLTLRSLPNLTTLDLSGTAVTNDGLLGLQEFPALKTLVLMDNPQITDAAVGNLMLLKDLERLHLENSSVTNKGVMILRESLPGCEIMN